MHKQCITQYQSDFYKMVCFYIMLNINMYDHFREVTKMVEFGNKTNIEIPNLYIIE